MSFPPEAAEKARLIRMALLDVDGVMTDGSILFLGDTELKAFHATDGIGIRLAQRVGIEVGVITGRSSAAVEQRCKELDITEVHMGDWQKLPAFEDILQRRGIPAEQICYMGDDLVDLPILRRVGLAAAVPDSAPEVLEVADVVSRRRGGHGAVREVLEGIIRVQGRWDEIMELYP